MGKYITKFQLPLLIICIGVVARLIPHPANFTPITATALFSGVYLSKKYAFIVPITIMILTDLILGFNNSTPIIYSCFIISGFMGLWLRNNKNMTNIFGATLLSSLIFYLLTNFNYWYATSLYSKDAAGLINSYIAAIPFFKNELAGNIIYTGVFFGGYELAKNYRLNSKLEFKS